MHLSIRLSVDLFKKMADKMVIEQKSKSLLLREILEDYLDGNMIRNDNLNQNNKGNKRHLNEKT